jgi:hypothetical protein
MTIKRTGTLGSIVAVASTMACAAHAADVDWKVYGFASVAGPEVCFYEAISIARPPDGSVRVWTKCLAQKDLDAVDIKAEYGGKIVQNAARKMNRNYVPPIATVVETIDFDQATIITAYEETANISYIKPHSTIFYEFNCAEKMMRELSLRIETNGQYGSSDTPSAWKFVPPESNGARLIKLLCRVG